MLLLTRNTGKSIVLDGGIVVTVLGVKGNQVRLGISAPSSVDIHREEIHDRIHGAGSFDTLFQNLERK